MSEITTPQQEQVLTRVDTMGESSDSRTASENGGVVNNEDSCLETFGSLRCVLARGHVGAHASAKADVDAVFGPPRSPQSNVITADTIPALIAERDALRDQIAQLRTYAQHAPMCMQIVAWAGSLPCDCGLNALLSSCPATGEGR